VLERDGKRRLHWDHADGREQRCDCKHNEDDEQDHGKPEAFSATPGGIVEDLPISHGAALIRERPCCQ
jgi:hypothetical protein